MAVNVVCLRPLLQQPSCLLLNGDLLCHHPRGCRLRLSLDRIHLFLSLVHVPLNHVLYVLLLVVKHFVDFVLLLLLEQ